MSRAERVNRFLSTSLQVARIVSAEGKREIKVEKEMV